MMPAPPFHSLAKIMTGTESPPSRPWRALILMTGATLSFTLMAISGRELGGRLDTFEIMTWRSLLGLIIISGLIAWRGEFSLIRTQKLWLHGIRNIAHFTGQNLWLYAVTMIPISQVFAFEFSVPIWVALTAPFFLNEKLTRARLIAALLGFVGILIIARPGAAELSPGVIAAILCAFGFTATSLATKLLTRTEATLTIMFWLTAIQLLLGLLCAGYDLEIRAPAWADLHWVIAIGLCGLAAHFFITSALSCAPATVVAPLDFTRLPLAALIGVMFYDEPLLLSVLLGAAVIFGANFVNILRERKKTART